MKEGPVRIHERVAPVYDLYSGPMEWMGGARRRRRVLARATGEVLEARVGTGLNLAHDPEGSASPASTSQRMLSHARRRAEAAAVDVTLDGADVDDLPYRDDRFDTSTATCVSCSVADPVQGLRELARVTKPEGRVLLLKHVRPRNRLMGALADLVSPLTRPPVIDQRTLYEAVAGRAAGSL